MRSRLLIVHNPRAGRSSRDRYHSCLLLLEQAGCTLEVVETGKPGEGASVASAAAESGTFDVIVAAGGDGTVHDVAVGTLGSSTPLGIIPTGTADVFARELELPYDPQALANVLQVGRVGMVPVGEVNGRPFLFVVGVGLDAEAVRIFENSGARGFGRMGLIWPALSASFNTPETLFQVTTAEGQANAQWLIVTRAKRYAANLLLAPEANLMDPGFHVLRMTGNRLTRLGQLAAMATGNLRNAPGVVLESADWVTVHGAFSVPVQIDGDLGGSLPLEVRAHARSLQVVLPDLT